MIAILPGHHSGALGATVGSHSEHAEACLLAAMIATRLDAAIITGTLREKVRQLDDLAPFAAIEIHYGSGKIESNSGHVAVACNERPLAREMQRAIVNTLPFARVDSGAYRNGEVDFFLQRSPCPSLIITIDDFANIAGTPGYRAAMCGAIVAGIGVGNGTFQQI
jgi:hypothetical protein